MATTLEHLEPARPRHGGDRLSEATIIETRKAKPVKWFAGVGVACLLMYPAMWIPWIVSGNFTRTAAGSTPMPGWMHFSIVAQQLLAIPETIIALWLLVVRPWRRAGKMTLDGYLGIALVSCYWQDSMSNMFGITWLYNANILNWGSWNNYLPLWITPHGNRFVEPMLWFPTVWFWGVLPPILITCWFMRKIAARHPRLGKVGLISAAFGIMVIFDLVLEAGFWMRTGMWVYPGAIKGLTLFYGHYYQFPIYEAVLWPAFWTFMAALRYYRNDRGETIAERGLDEIRATSKQKSVIKGLALIGITNLALFAYTIPMSMITLKGGAEWPADIRNRSYFTNQLCGPTTEYVCSNDYKPPRNK